VNPSRAIPPATCGITHALGFCSLCADRAPLKPCPFCGSEPRVHEYSSHGKPYRMRCTGYGCESMGPRRYEKGQAMQAWNHRSEVTVR
jgi:Lar family restriction alleviation protein